jgi:hypothetical protein
VNIKNLRILNRSNEEHWKLGVKEKEEEKEEIQLYIQMPPYVLTRPGTFLNMCSTLTHLSIPPLFYLPTLSPSCFIHQGHCTLKRG